MTTKPLGGFQFYKSFHMEFTNTFEVEFSLKNKSRDIIWYSYVYVRMFRLEHHHYLISGCLTKTSPTSLSKLSWWAAVIQLSKDFWLTKQRACFIFSSLAFVFNFVYLLGGCRRKEKKDWRLWAVRTKDNVDKSKGQEENERNQSKSDQI